jgi:hypothetical protein
MKNHGDSCRPASVEVRGGGEYRGARQKNRAHDIYLSFNWQEGSARV